MVQSIRRVVTGHDEQGRAVVISDGAAPFVYVSPLQPERFSVDIWRTFDTPAPIVAQAPESTLGPRRQLPTQNGAVLRINTIPPESEAMRRMTPEDSARAFEAMGNASATTHGKGGRHPLMHRTETIDYALILSGEITMLLDDGEVLLKAGDVVVQCGTNHAWSNRSDAPCTLAFFLVDGKYDDELAARLETAPEAE